MVPPTISIHALLAESDGISGPRICSGKLFLSTLSLRRATCAVLVFDCRPVISIHALLAESDPFLRSGPMMRQYFYPRSPCGERPIFAVRSYDAPIFLSTLSLRRATTTLKCPKAYQKFLSTLSLRRATQRKQSSQSHHPISIHALLAESDCPGMAGQLTSYGFLSTLSLRRATAWHGDLHWHWRHFYPRSPCGERRRYDTEILRSRQYFYPRSPCGERHNR